jgi:hypothetical protein
MSGGVCARECQPPSAKEIIMSDLAPLPIAPTIDEVLGTADHLVNDVQSAAGGVAGTADHLVNDTQAAAGGLLGTANHLIDDAQTATGGLLGGLTSILP